MPQVLFVRHGESTWNAEGRWQGWADAPLSAAGEQQACEAAGRLAALGLVAAAASDLVRARRTAELLADQLAIGPVHVDAGLRERDVGEWSGLTRAEIDARWPGLVDAWRRGEVDAPPGGEAEQAFRARVVAAAVRVTERLAGDGPLLVVAHGGVVRALEREAGEAPRTLPNLGGRWFAVDDGRVRAGPFVALLGPDSPSVAPVF